MKLGISQDEALQTDILAKTRIVEKSIDKEFTGLFLLALAMFVFNFLQMGIFNKIAEKIIHNLRLNYFRKMMYLDLKYFDQPEFHSGYLALNLNKSITLIRTLVSFSIPSLIQMLSSFILGLLICAYTSIHLAAIVFGVTSAIMIFKFYESNFTSYYAVLSREMNLKVLTETLGNMRVVKSLNAEHKILNQLTEIQKEEKKRRFQTSIFAGLIFGFSQLVNYAGYSVILIFGLIFGLQYGISFDDILQCFFMIVISMYGVIMAHEHIANFGLGYHALKSIIYCLFLENEIEIDPQMNLKNSKEVIVNSVDKIEFKNVNFMYENQSKFVLKNLNVIFTRNSIHGIFGKSASGKSAIVELLLRFYDPQSGVILVNDVPLTDMNIYYLRSVFGVLLQDTRLFNEAIDENIKAGKSLSDEEVRELANKTNCLSFIYANPEAFKRKVGQFGQNLSGGQKQRILIARFLGRKSKVAILDEPTSALDLENEKRIQAMLKNSKKDNLMIIFSTKAVSLNGCDQVSVLGGGKIIESGTVQELMKLQGKFFSVSSV